MSFGVDKCAALEMKRGRKVGNIGIEFPNMESTKDVDNSCYKYLDVLQMDKTLNGKMKSQVWEEYV